ncbi:MAG: hypothetical protein FWE07_08525 [Turicibacter sp.]|nr:hypothetical protein [Turicibacter sp.]
MTRLTNNDKKYWKRIAIIIFSVNVLIILLLPIIMPNISFHDVRRVSTEDSVTSIGLALLSINVLCVGAIFSLKFDPDEEDSNNEDPN